MTNVDLIGSSPEFQTVLEEIKLVAGTDTGVLIQGETGTGKELVARAIHEASHRRHKPFVAVNCAAIPAALIESDLFGHERGAFTGAISQKLGRFQLAHGGTLFLDEIGDLPLELQPKLLRALQERQFEPVGGTRAVKVDVRVVAATHQDLWQMSQDRRFRPDLYYRLSVFPLELPALRERRSDIPLLAEHFVKRFAAEQGKLVESIPPHAIEILTNYHWPGNIRELQNCIERSVIRTAGPVLELCKSGFLRDESGPAVTLVDAQRVHILVALRGTNWVIGGPRGAAERLGMARTTLLARMRKLGIRRPGMPDAGDDKQLYQDDPESYSETDTMPLDAPAYQCASSN